MSAEVALLRRAAALMRERALGTGTLDEARGAGWVAMPTIDPDNHGWTVAYDLDADGWDTRVVDTPYDYEGHLAQHIAAFAHPGMALAVADWLEDAAAAISWSERPGAGEVNQNWPALVVARTYLGEQS